jgi:hypothetical protein
LIPMKAPQSTFPVLFHHGRMRTGRIFGQTLYYKTT